MSYEKEIKVLDHGYVKYVGHLGCDEDIVADARMSTGGGNKTPEEDKKLLNFLWENEHTSPFEGVDLKLEVQLPIFVFRELERHRTLTLIETEILAISTTDNSSRCFVSKNEFSGRYAKMPELNYIPVAERLGKQGKINHQGTEGDLTDEVKTSILDTFKAEQMSTRGNYEGYLSQGLSREVARMNLNLSQYTKLRIKANVLNWFKFLNLRLRNNAQYEIRVYAQAVESIMKDLFPWSYSAFEEYTYGAVKFSSSEMTVLRGLLNTIDENNVAPTLNNLGWTKSKTEKFLTKLALNSEDL
jgi:thymidylate synthase (FAD)